MCESVHERPPHAYQTIPLSELMVHAYADPLAALQLAIRMKLPLNASELERAGIMQVQRDLIARSSALSGKTGPFIRFSEWKLGSGVLVTPTENGLEYSYHLDTLAMKAAVLNVAAEMGDDRARPDAAIAQLGEIIEDKLPEENLEAWLADIENQTRVMRENMAQIKSVVGI